MVMFPQLLHPLRPGLVFFLSSLLVAARADSLHEGEVLLDASDLTALPEGTRHLAGKSDGSEVLLVFMFCGMVIGAVTSHVLSRIKMNIPYTVVVFLLGVLLYIIVDTKFYFGRLEDSVKQWNEIDPELLLYLFLPALLFGEAMNLSWYKVKACFYQAALLAGPGVIIGAYLMGLILYYICPFGWSWYLCMIFGSITSATDPVAVVAILKDLGASPKLTILIVGESLMNDGTAMVLFTLYLKLMEGEDFSGGDIIWFLVKMIIFSPLLGIVFGLFGVFWLSKANNPLGSQDTTIQIAITVSTAYLVFYVAQYECEISGILACCGAGLMFAFLAPPLILEQETMHSVWGFIEWTGNTLIFLLAGVIIGSNLDNNNIKATDFGYVLALYLILLLVRALVVLILYPGLSGIGLKASAAEANFMVWAGLRGALAIALSLIVYDDHEEMGITKKEADRLFFYIGGIAALTLLVNATTAQHLLTWLGLLTDETEAEAASTLDVVKDSMRTTLFAEMKNFKNDSCNRYSTRMIHMAEIVKFNSLLGEYDANGARGGGPRSSQSSDSNFSSMVPSNILQRHITERAGFEDMESAVIDSSMLTYYRKMFLESIRRKYWKYIEDGRLPRGEAVTTTLLYSIDTSLRRVSFQGNRDWEFLEKRMKPSAKVLWFAETFSDYIPRWITKYSLRDRVMSWNAFLKVYLLTSFIDAHEEAQASFIRTLSGVDIKSEENMLVEQQKVLAESRESVSTAKAALQSLDQKVVSAIMIQQTARLLLAKETHNVHHLLDEGILQPKEADKLFTMILADYKKLDSAKFETFTETIADTVQNRLSMMLPDDIKTKVKRNGCNELLDSEQDNDRL